MRWLSVQIRSDSLQMRSATAWQLLSEVLVTCFSDCKTSVFSASTSVVDVSSSISSVVIRACLSQAIPHLSIDSFPHVLTKVSNFHETIKKVEWILKNKFKI